MVHQSGNDMKGNPFDLADAAAYRAWRERKIETAPGRIDDLVVEIFTAVDCLFQWVLRAGDGPRRGRPALRGFLRA